MDKKILEALKNSIALWKVKKINKLEDIAGRKCPLCWVCSNCTKCPVMRRTRVTGCLETPWEELYYYLEKHHPTDTDYDNYRIEKYRREEIAFLESLLPEEETLTCIKNHTVEDKL